MQGSDRRWKELISTIHPLSRVGTHDEWGYILSSQIKRWSGQAIWRTRHYQTSSDADLEIYLDGNVVFRLGDNVVYADRMYYDVKNYVGIIEDAEMYAHAPDDEDAVFRLGANKITQRGLSSVYADDAWVTTSKMGRPNYRLQADSLITESSSVPLRDAATDRC